MTWSLPERLSGQGSATTNHTTNINSEQIASKLVGIFKVVKSKLKNHSVTKIKMTCNAVVKEVSTEELDATIKSLKLTKTASTDGILPEFIHHLEPYVTIWCARLSDSIFEKKLRTIYGNMHKPGKSGKDAHTTVPYHGQWLLRAGTLSNVLHQIWFWTSTQNWRGIHWPHCCFWHGVETWLRFQAVEGGPLHEAGSTSVEYSEQPYVYSQTQRGRKQIANAKPELLSPFSGAV